MEEQNVQFWNAWRNKVKIFNKISRGNKYKGPVGYICLDFWFYLDKSLIENP